MFSRKNIPLFCYLTTFAILSIHRAYAHPERKSTTDDAKITEISLLELPEAGELYEMVPQVVDNEENPTSGNPEASQILPPVYIHGVPYIFKHKFYYQHRRWLPKAYIKGNFYKMCSNNAKCKFIVIMQNNDSSNEIS
ncbi:hypothetical protein RclHR1_01740014 [Rhizophagus clarus]|uniref:Uncharacterized protein n=1 Tax=Rhizophagus clarus TaxID=94130 RepID=A0A2Z6QK01_9GLOM|nr:hypothetical protein RclHR1_01740014 [Rhizophagus clarus]GET02782.1 hypothetical protein GLOIN_2v1639827 [Rhizophagus clarus]